MQTPFIAFASVCMFFLAVPLVVASVVSIGERLSRIRTRPGFEVTLITGPAVPPPLPVLLKKEDDHG
jgi:hypothetical protein